MSIRNKLIITTGGTGGHYFPAIATAICFAQNGHKVLLIADERCKKFKKKLDASGASELDNLSIKDIKIERSKGKIRFARDLIKSFFTSFGLMLSFAPNKILSFGSYASVPVVMAGLLTFKTLYLHEQNAVFGTAVKLFKPFARKVFTSFKMKKKSFKIKHVGNPHLEIAYKTPEDVISSIVSSIESAINPKEINISIIAGSQGSDCFDKTIPDGLVFLSQLLNKSDYILNVSFQARSANIKTVHQKLLKMSNTKNIEVSNFFVNIEDKLSLSEIVIIRCGAASIIDAISSGSFPVIIPIANSKNNHQEENAQ